MSARAFEEAGLPPGVLNVVFGDPPTVGRVLATDPRLRLLSFTGGTQVGKDLSALCAGTMKRMIMELGGHAPVIVCDDVDPVRVGHLAGAAKFRMAGQICVSPTRFIVHEAIYAPFVKAFAEAARQGYAIGASHLSFPGIGTLRAEGQGYVFQPTNYSTQLKK